MLELMPAAVTSSVPLGPTCPSSSTWREQGLTLPQCRGFCQHLTLAAVLFAHCLAAAEGTAVPTARFALLVWQKLVWVEILTLVAVVVQVDVAALACLALLDGSILPTGCVGAAGGRCWRPAR